MSLLYVDRFQATFMALPAYTFLYGLFLQAWTWLHLPLTYFTYAVFHAVVLSALLWTAARLAFVLAPSPAHGRRRAALLLVLLGISPFVVDMPHLRPEPVGLLALTAALLLIASASHRPSDRLRYLGAGALLGFAATTHPSLAITAGLTALAAFVLLVYRRLLPMAVAAAAAGLLAPALTWLWYAHNAPTSWNMLLAHVEIRTLGLSSFAAGLRAIGQYVALQLPADTALPVRIYYAILFLVLAVAILWLLARIWRLIVDGWRQRRLPASDAQILVCVFFLAALLNLLLDRQARIQIYTVMAYASVLGLACLPGFAASRDAAATDSSRRGWMALAAVAACLCVSFNPLTHILKRQLLPTPRYSALSAIDLVRPDLRPGDMILFTSDRFLPPFADLADDTYAGRASIPAHWFPSFFHGSPQLKADTISAFACLIARHGAREVVWGVQRRDLSALDPATRMASFHIDARDSSLLVGLRYKAILYDFYDGLYLRGRIERMDHVIPNPNGAQRELLFQAPGRAPGCRQR